MNIENKKQLTIFFLLIMGYAGFAQMDTLCSAIIVEDTTETGVFLKAEVMGTPPFQYEWSGNFQTESIFPNGTSSHSVTIVDANDCITFAEYDYIDRDSSNHLIEGRIRNRGNSRDILFEGKVYLYQQLIGQEFELVDSISFGAAGEWSPFSFGTVEPGIYILQATLHPNSDGYDEFLSTYYGPTTEWQNARLIHIPYSGTRSADMGMYSRRIADGDGIISGTLVVEGSFRGQAKSRNQNDLAGYQILLFNESNRAIDNSFTNISGHFSFESIALGKYFLAVEKTGYFSEQMLIELDNASPLVDNLRFIVDVSNRTINGLLTTAINKTTQTPIRIFPNPSSSLLTIESSEEIIQVQLFDSLGRVAKWSSNQKEMNITSLTRGIYWLYIQTERQLFVDKIMKN